MKSSGAGPDEPMDQFDLAVLDGIRQIFELTDPMPADLPERIMFSLAMRVVEAEVARLAAEEDPRLLAAAARGAEQSRTITFDSASLTIMIRIDSDEDGTVRIDGWLAPPQRREIEIQTEADTLHVLSDEEGRFVFTDVPRGTARLSVRPGEPKLGGSGRPVVTPALVL
jgi:hypothetical protein